MSIEDKTMSDDQKFHSIIEDNRTLPEFLDSVFGFLSRNTDFFVVAEDPSIGIGLPKNYAESLVFQTFKKWQKKSLEPLKVQESSHTVHSLRKSSTSNKNDLLHENGAIFDTYSWSQTIGDVEIYVVIPDNFAVKNISIKLINQQLNVIDKVDNTKIFDGELSGLFKRNSMLWSIDGHVLSLHLEKLKPYWWKKLLITEPEIDLKKIDPSEPVSELSDPARAKLDEILYNQSQREKGLPTVAEKKVYDTLKESWNVEGSPFEGDFDPSKVKIN